jgi:8-oxo-dGTP diphosphatase
VCHKCAKISLDPFPRVLRRCPIQQGAHPMPASSTQTSKRTGASVNAYLILKKNDQVLLSLRRNTGYLDGFYGLVAGHVEDGESATTAMLREAHEEAGIELTPSQLNVVHVLHRQTNRFNVDVFFECSSWQERSRTENPTNVKSWNFSRLTTFLRISWSTYVKFFARSLKEAFIRNKGGSKISFPSLTLLYF